MEETGRWRGWTVLSGGDTAFVFCCCVTTPPRLSDLKQQTLTTPWFLCGLEVLKRLGGWLEFWPPGGCI